MPVNDIELDELVRTLTNKFNILADEVQLLSDRKQILEHKLRFAHELYQELADKYASGDLEISNTLAKLQLPPDVQTSAPDQTGLVPLPQRKNIFSKQQTAVAIRDGRRAARRLVAVTGKSTGSTVSGRSTSGDSSNVRYSAQKTSLSTVLEQDFTVEGRKSLLLCPFSRPETRTNAAMDPRQSQTSGSQELDRPLTPSDVRDLTRHQSGDPICAALCAENMNSPPPSATGSAAKCPIRYMNQHSPEEIAQYFESHKHEIPRSHEVCVKRYQRNEDDIRKLDAKYGNLVSMIQGLGQKHQPMLPTKEEEEALELERTSNQRVENWAHAISADGVEPEEHEAAPEKEEDDRESRFDRPLKEIRVGESPSRPWGISVPIFEPPEGQRPVSPPPAPVSAERTPRPMGKCPFERGTRMVENKSTPPSPQERPAGKCPFPHAAATDGTKEATVPPLPQASKPQAAPNYQPQPIFIQSSEVLKSGGLPPMTFTGPVFIGYPIEQAITFMQQYKDVP